MDKKRIKSAAAVLLFAALLTALFGNSLIAFANDENEYTETPEVITLGGGYAASGQTDNSGYISRLYDASNGLITSDANYVLCASNGYIWIGGYGGIIRYDGTVFTRMDTSDGLTSGRGLFEDSSHRIWVGTNDNGVVVIDGSERKHYTYEDGLSSSSIRSFAEDDEGNIYIGTTSGVCCVDTDMKLSPLDDERINGERVLRLDSDSKGRVYGQTKNGAVFLIKDSKVAEFCESSELGTEKITTILADRLNDGFVYLGTDSGAVYYGRFGDKADKLERIDVSPLSDIHWISYDCGRVWVSSTTAVGYIGEDGGFHILDDLSVNSGIEMSTSDYQGNMWFASSRQGVMKITASSFVDVTEKAGLPANVTNAVCLYDNALYIGTDSGLSIIGSDGSTLENELTRYIGNSRIRCIASGKNDDLWVGVFTNGLGLIRYTSDGTMTSFTKDNGMPGDEIRCISVMKDGAVLAGTNNGLAVIRDGRITDTVDSDDVSNTVILDVEEGANGEIYAGTDGDGIYVIDGGDIRRIGREDGLTSDVVMRIKRDETRGLYWLVTSNSIEYMKDGSITCVKSFPYNNNYDLYFDSNDQIWVISSCGIYTADADDMLNDRVSDHRLYSTSNGLPSLPSSYAFCALRDDGTLFIPCKTGVCSVNINSFANGDAPVKAAVSSVFFGNTEILPDKNGRYIIPAGEGRIRIVASVLDYTLMDPNVQVYFEGDEADGINTAMSSLTALEYTDLGYGDHILHIKVTDNSGNKLLDKTFHIEKKPRITELPAFRITLIIAAAALAGVIVWRVTRSAVMRRQNEELRRAKNEAELANTTRTRFLDNMSHDILTPINTIVGINEMTLREDTSGVPAGYSAAVRNYATDIRNASESLMYLVHDLLDITALESNGIHLVMNEYDIGEVLRELISVTEQRCQEKGLQFSVSVDELMPRRMYGDIGKIRQIIMKLLSNSVKYTDAGGVDFRVSLEERNDNEGLIRFSIKDTGLGFSGQKKEKIFTVYKRLGEEDNKEALGTEIGLSLAFRFAELMGGKLDCESEYGKGTEFVMTLSQRIIDREPIGPVSWYSEATALRNYVPLFRAPDADVLVVSDDYMTIKVIKGLIKATEVFVTTASTAEECADKMLGTRFNIVLVDQMISGSDESLLEMLRNRDESVPVYAVTANVTADEELYRSKGYNGCIAKPIDGTVLERTIMKHLPEEIMEKPDDLFTRR